MKFTHIFTAAALMLSVSAFAQTDEKKEVKEEEGFKFTTVKELPITSVKDQNQNEHSKWKLYHTRIKP